MIDQIPFRILNKAIAMLTDSHIIHIAGNVGKADVHKDLQFLSLSVLHILTDSNYPGVIFFKEGFHMGLGYAKSFPLRFFHIRKILQN